MYAGIIMNRDAFVKRRVDIESLCTQCNEGRYTDSSPQSRQRRDSPLYTRGQKKQRHRPVLVYRAVSLCAFYAGPYASISPLKIFLDSM